MSILKHKGLLAVIVVMQLLPVLMGCDKTKDSYENSYIFEANQRFFEITPILVNIETNDTRNYSTLAFNQEQLFVGKELLIDLSDRISAFLIENEPVQLEANCITDPSPGFISLDVELDELPAMVKASMWPKIDAEPNLSKIMIHPMYDQISFYINSELVTYSLDEASATQFIETINNIRQKINARAIEDEIIQYRKIANPSIKFSSIEEILQNGYPKNDFGETFGITWNGQDIEAPDLVAVIGSINGKAGYIKPKMDIPNADITSFDDAVQYLKLSEIGSVPVYTHDGKTIIDYLTGEDIFSLIIKLADAGKLVRYDEIQLIRDGSEQAIRDAAILIAIDEFFSTLELGEPIPNQDIKQPSITLVLSLRGKEQALFHIDDSGDIEWNNDLYRPRDFDFRALLRLFE